jgi:hypothetical protein
MALTPTYIRQQSIPQTSGQQMAPLSLASNGVAEAAGDVSDVLRNAVAEIQKADERVKSRESHIEKARAIEEYNTFAFEFSGEAKKTGDALGRNFMPTATNQLNKARQDLIEKFNGTADDKADLESKLSGIYTGYFQDLAGFVTEEQKKFIKKEDDTQINKILADAMNKPGYLEQGLKDARNVLDKSSHFFGESEQFQRIKAVESMVFESAADGLMTRGHYDQAFDLLKKDDVKASMESAKYKNYMRDIINIKNEQIRKKEEKAIELAGLLQAAKKFGINISAEDAFRSVYDLPDATSKANQDWEKADAFWALARKNDPSLPRETPTKIYAQAAGFNFPDNAERDYNKDYFPDGKLGPQGIAKIIKPAIEAAKAARTYSEKLTGAMNEFKRTGNTQAILAAAIVFQKALDEGTAVREGDIVLARSAEGVSAKFTNFIQALEGQVFSNKLLLEMEDTMAAFTRDSLSSAREFVDPYIEDGFNRGIRDLEMGIPRSSYARLFGAEYGTRIPPAPTRQPFAGNQKDAMPASESGIDPNTAKKPVIDPNTGQEMPKIDLTGLKKGG